MPTTRSATGSSKPRIIQQIEAAVAPKKRTTKANTSKPRDKKVNSGRVSKTGKATTGTAKPKKTVEVKKSTGKKIKDKIVGKSEKGVADVEGKPGKKAAAEKKSKSTTTKKISAAPKTKATVKA